MPRVVQTEKNSFRHLCGACLLWHVLRPRWFFTTTRMELQVLQATSAIPNQVVSEPLHRCSRTACHRVDSCVCQAPRITPLPAAVAATDCKDLIPKSPSLRRPFQS